MNFQNRFRIKTSAAVASVAVVPIFLVVLLTRANAAEQGVREATRLKFAEFYEPPNQKQMKSLLEGARVQRLPDGHYLCTDAKFQTFRENGATQTVVEAPECIYDEKLKTLGSGGPLQMRSGDGAFSIAGEGFLLQQTNSNLIISNRVHTVIQALSLQILADHFDYATNSGLGTYLGHVRATGTNLALTSGMLKLLVPMGQGGKATGLQDLQAQENVVLDYEGVHLTGDEATYAASNGLARVTGHPTWKSEQREGSAEELIIDRSNAVFYAKGQAYFKMTGQSAGSTGFFPRTDSAASTTAASSNDVVEIRCESYDLRTNLFVFRKDTRLVQSANGLAKGTMNCNLLTVEIAGTNQLQSMVAEGGVIIEQGDQGFTAAKAAYEANSGALELTGSPAWHAGPRQGRGNVIRVYTARNEMMVYGNASMRVPASELGQSSFGSPSHIATTNEGFADLLADQYHLKPAVALFLGHVRITHPRMTWACEQMEIESPTSGQRPQLMIAERDVAFELSNGKGQTVQGNGQKAVYTSQVTASTTNELLELTGNPTLVTTNGVFRNQIILLDPVRNKVYAPGKYQIRGLVPAGMTNRFRVPVK